jgi:hypothetical protein
MGLLDDAIRQHLDLKRRHGAPSSDVAKLEREAFGPGELAEPAALPEPVAPGAHEAPYDEEHSRHTAALDREADWASAPPVAPPPRKRAAPPPEAVAPAFIPAPEPEPEPLRPGGSVPLDDIGERTVEHSTLGHEPDPQPDGEELDELEETPEFLQETPEHDRLWFEQKPPRDFDF